MNFTVNIKDKLLDSFNRVEGTITQKSRGDKYVWGIVFFLIVASLALIYSSTSALAYKSETANSRYLIRQLTFVLGGLAIVYVVQLFDYRYLSRGIIITFLIVSVLLLIYTKLKGSSVNSATRWVSILGIKFQSSDFAKVAIFLYVSYYLARRQEIIKEFRKTFLTIIVPPAIVCAIIAMDNFSTGAMLFAVTLVLCFVGRVNVWYLAIPAVAGIAIYGTLIFFAHKYYDKDKEKMTELPAYLNVGRMPTWISRVQASQFPTLTNDRDRQSNLSKVAIAEGGFLGKLPGNSTQKNFLPDCFSDFIFAIIIEEYGMFGALICMILYMGLLARGIIIFRRCPFAFGAFLALGLSFGLTIQALLNMAVAVNIFPVTGFTLPFLSMGGTSFLLTCLSIGLILSVSRHSDEYRGVKEEKPVIA